MGFKIPTSLTPEKAESSLDKLTKLEGSVTLHKRNENKEWVQIPDSRDEFRMGAIIEGKPSCITIKSKKEGSILSSTFRAVFRSSQKKEQFKSAIEEIRTLVATGLGEDAAVRFDQQFSSPWRKFFGSPLTKGALIKFVEQEKEKYQKDLKSLVLLSADLTEAANFIWDKAGQKLQNEYVDFLNQGNHDNELAEVSAFIKAKSADIKIPTIEFGENNTKIAAYGRYELEPSAVDKGLAKHLSIIKQDIETNITTHAVDKERKTSYTFIDKNGHAISNSDVFFKKLSLSGFENLRSQLTALSNQGFSASIIDTFADGNGPEGALTIMGNASNVDFSCFETENPHQIRITLNAKITPKNSTVVLANKDQITDKTGVYNVQSSISLDTLATVDRNTDDITALTCKSARGTWNIEPK